MSYQAKGLQLSLLIHGAVFLLIANTGISESRLSPPVTIDLGIIREIVEEPAPPPLPEEKKIEEIQKVEEIIPPPKIEPAQKKELPVRTKKIPKKIARAVKKEAPPVKQEEVKEQAAPPASDPVPQTSDDNKILGSAFSENSAVAAPAPSGSGEEGGVEGGTGTSKSGSVLGSDEGDSDNMTFGSASGPKYRRKEMPIYPSIARRLGREGKVVLRLTIDENGNLVNVEVIEDSGYGFADAAIAAVKKSTFHPPMMNGKPIRARALLPVKFELR